MAQCLADIVPGLHALGRVDDVLVTFALIVTRHLEVVGHRAFRTAYLELVGTSRRCGPPPPARLPRMTVLP